MNVEVIDKMGRDLSVVNAARVSFSKFTSPYYKIIGILITAENKTSKMTTSASFFFKYWL